MRRRSQLQFKRQVWRITSDAPLGRWVDREVERFEQPQPEERFGPGLQQSSFELAFGLHVRDAMDTVPAVPTHG